MTFASKFSIFFTLILSCSITNQVNAQTDIQIEEKPSTTIETETIELNIFPNPSSGTFYITTIKNESYQSQLYTMDGTLAKTLNLHSGLNYVSIDVPEGIYMLEVNKGDLHEQFKIVIK